MTRVQIAIYVVLGIALAVSVVTDLRTRKILNLVTFPAMVLPLLLRLAEGIASGNPLGTPTTGLLSGILGLLAGGVVFLVMALMGGMGMGDVKLVAAVGAAVGFPLVLACLIFIAVVGGVQAVAMLVWRGRLLSTLGGMLRGVLARTGIVRDARPGPAPTRIPYGVAIAFGTAWGVWWSSAA